MYGKLIWLTNMQDFRSNPDAVIMHFGETREEALARAREYVAGKFIGDPKATDTCSVEYLKSIGYVGIYAVEPPTPQEATDDHK